MEPMNENLSAHKKCSLMREMVLLVAVVMLGAASGVLLKRYAIWWPSAALLLMLLILGVLTGGIKYKSASLLSQVEQNRSIVACMVLVLGFVLAIFLSYVLA